MNHSPVDIFVVIAATVVAVVLARLVPPQIVLIRALTLPLVLVLPGYALISASFPRRPLGIAERLVFSLGLSLAVVILGGLLLNLTPVGLRVSTWAVFLASITLGASAVALVRQSGQSMSAPEWWRIRNVGLTPRQGLLLGLAAAIVCGAVAVSITAAERQSNPGFTQLWMLPAGTSGGENTVHLGVGNMQSTDMKYRLVVNVDGRTVIEWPVIDLQPQATWEGTLVLPSTKSLGDARVEADLYRGDAPTVIYRHVVLWLGS